jgi:hypothetical protein
MTQFAKALIAAFYGNPPSHSYFAGCSTGGQQALMEAECFPSDYDGILAGAPAHNRTHLHTVLIGAISRDPHAFDAQRPIERLYPSDQVRRDQPGGVGDNATDRTAARQLILSSPILATAISIRQNYSVRAMSTHPPTSPQTKSTR